MTKDQFYEQQKKAWLALHPDPTPLEYQRAMRKIAKKLNYRHALV